MSTPKKHMTWGEILLEGKTYGVLGGLHLNNEILSKYEKNIEHKKCIKTTAQWETMKIKWSIENNILYLTKLCKDGLLKELMGREIIVATWVKEMILLEYDNKVCKTYEQYGSYLKKMKILKLTFYGGVHVKTKKKNELYTSIEYKNYTDKKSEYCNITPISTLRIDSDTLINYLDGKKTDGDKDIIFDSITNFIESVTKNKDIIVLPLSIKDVKDVLKKSEVAVMTSVRGKEVEKMVSSTSYSLTDGVLQAKGCLVKLTLNESQYPDVTELLYGLASKLGLSDEDQFIIGVEADETMLIDEIKIEVLVGI